MSREDQVNRAAHEAIAQHRPGVSVRLKHAGDFRQLHKRLEVGRIEEPGLLVLDDTDIEICRRRLETEGIDPARGPAPEGPRSRLETAAYQSREKQGSMPAGRSAGLVAMAVLGSSDIWIGKHRIAVGLPGSYQVIPPKMESVTGCDWILTVENYEPFLEFARAPDRLLDLYDGPGLMVLRTSPTYPNGMTWARAIRHQSGIHHSHAPDLDWAGLAHVLAHEPDSVLLPALEEIELGSHLVDHTIFDRQHRERQACEQRLGKERPECASWLDWINACRGGLMQERMLAMNLTMTVVHKT